MKKTIITTILFLTFFIGFACDCETPKPAIEFYNSEYVFEGNVISKIYSKDSLTYKVIFDIYKHYKQGAYPKKLEFTFISEGEFTGNYNSCDWNVEKGEKWLVYAYYWKDKLTFSYMCSNSKTIDRIKVGFNEQKALDNGNNLKLDEYLFSSLEGNFNKSKPKIDIDSILVKFKEKNYQTERVNIITDIDKNGKLIIANLDSKEYWFSKEYKVIDTIFGLNKRINREYRKPENEFEKDMLEIIRSIHEWDKTYFNNNNEPINVRKYIQLYYDREKGITIYY